MIENATFITTAIDRIIFHKPGTFDASILPSKYDLYAGITVYNQYINLEFKSEFCPEKEILLITCEVVSNTNGMCNSELFKATFNENLQKFVFVKNNFEFSKFYQEFKNIKTEEILNKLNSMLKGWKIES